MRKAAGRKEAAPRVPAGHLDGAQLERFLRGETSRAENRELIRHLLRRCPQCQEAAGTTWRKTEPSKELR